MKSSESQQHGLPEDVGSESAKARPMQSMSLTMTAMTVSGRVFLLMGDNVLTTMVLMLGKRECISGEESQHEIG